MLVDRSTKRRQVGVMRTIGDLSMFARESRLVTCEPPSVSPSDASPKNE